MENNFFENTENDLDACWDVIRKRNSDHSFPTIASWIRETHKSLKKSRLQKGKKRRLTWFAIAILPVFLIVSCTIHVDTVKQSGSLVNFSIDKQKKESFQKLSSLQQIFAFTSYEFFQPGIPGVASFIFFIPDKERSKLFSITKGLNELNGLKKLEIAPVNYTIRESLFSTFMHQTLKVGKTQKPEEKELFENIRTTLKKKELDFLSIHFLDDSDGNIVFTSAAKKPDSSITTNANSLPADNKKNQNDQTSIAPPGTEKLQVFNWLVGSWKIKFAPYAPKTYHHWLRVSDSLLMCFIIKYNNDEPEVSIGFSIRYSKSDSAILSLRGIKWGFLTANDKEVRFKNETTPKSANVKWSLGDEKKSWQSVISGEKNLEIVNLIRTENINLENIVKDFIARNPDIINSPINE